MGAADTYVALANENGTFTLLGRVCAEDATGSDSPVSTEGKLIKQADLTSATLYVYDLSTKTQVTGSPVTLSIPSVIYDTLQTTYTWGLIEGGGNFRYVVAASLVPEADTSYACQVKFVPTGGAEYQTWGKWRIETRGVLPV